jgi:hypothetical protein
MPSPAPDLIPAEPKNQPKTHIAIGTANGGTFKRNGLHGIGLEKSVARRAPRVSAVQRR